MSDNELKIVSVRLVEEQAWRSEAGFSAPKEVAHFLSEKLSQYDRELFCILNMSTKTQVINMNIASIGTVNAALIEPREVFKTAILSNASCIMLAHNHPSGVVNPSREDLQITERLESCGRLLGIPVLDHFIIGQPGEYYSFAENDLLNLQGRERVRAADGMVRSR